MKLVHLHIGVTDLAETLAWFEEKGEFRPVFSNNRLSYFDFGGITVVFEQGGTNVPVTLAFGTPDLENMYQKFIDRGAVSVTPPTDQPWGVRSAYLKGPAAVTIELEQSRGIL